MDVQQLFKILKKEAECPLCIETVTNPKTLPCLHSFCLECLDRHANFARRQLKATIKCPVCQTSFQIPETDTFENLPSSFHLNRLVDVLALEDGSVQSQRCNSCDENNTATSYCFVCQDFLCASCFEAHQRLKASRGHRNVLIDKLQAQDVQELIHRPVMCSQQYHEDQPLEFYCEDCKVLICHKCTVVSHDRHYKTDTQKAAQEQKMQMSDVVAKVKAEIVRYESEIKKQTDLRRKNKIEILNEEKKMTDTVEKLIRDLREQERKMKEKFREIYEAEHKHHATRLENFELVATQLKSCFERCQSILERNFSVEILQTNHAILGRCNEPLNVRKPNLYMSPHIHYLVEKELDLMDRVVVTKTDPSKCLAEGQDSKEVKERKETYFVIVTKDSEEFQCYQQDDKIKVNILTPEGDQLKTDIKDIEDGKYTVTYTPQCAGQHRVDILVNGQPLTGSPWIVQHQYQFAFQFGSKGKGQGEFYLSYTY
ncbi:E3 ubiquitin-protein ligase TRIM71-like [Montipora capricornis]|uniref:E3 ubiquitin-protein ligase TRIM71-like n=1 Tax=Montipora capricornis TaxID=246305 RepID=UPI0035F1EDB9